MLRKQKLQELLDYHKRSVAVYNLLISNIITIDEALATADDIGSKFKKELVEALQEDII